MKTLQDIDKLNIKKDLAKILNKYSSKTLTTQEIQNLYNKDKNVKHYMKLLQEFKDSSASSEQHFESSLIKFMTDALHSDEDELHQIMLIYLQLTASYMTDFFNTEGLKDKKKHIKNMKKLFYDSTLNVITTYESNLLKTIEKINQDLDSARVPSTFLNKQQLNKAIKLHQSGELDKAAAIYKSILKEEKDNFDALHLLGTIALRKEQWHEALTLFDKAILVAPDYAQAYSNKGMALVELGLLDEALESYNLAIAIKPKYANAHYGKGIVLRKLKHPNDSLQSYTKAIEIEPNNAEYLFKQGVILGELKQFDEAIKSYKKAININPDLADAYYNIGNILKELEEFSHALQNYDKAIFIQPDHENAYFNRGVILTILDRFDEALISYNKAISLKPNWADAYFKQALVLSELNRLDEALISHDKAMSFGVDNAKAYYKKGFFLKSLKRFDEALENYDHAITLDPNYPKTYLNKAMLLLLLGDFKKGFELYEWRFKKDHHFSQPLWLGEESLKGKTILLYNEQGLGDTIQFCRYAKQVVDLGAKVILQTQQSLIGLLRGLNGISEFVTEGSVLPPFDYQCPLLSLPHALNTTIDTIPNNTAYLFSDKDIVDIWRDRIGIKTKLRIGIAWSGNAKHMNDHNRSIVLGDFIEKLPKNYEYISLQKEIQDSDKKTLLVNPQIKHFEDSINDFSDTAAICELVDIVISVDTSIAHLSAAMGKQTWILLPYIPDWRWLLDRKDSPWYSSAKLYRQDKTRVWTSVLEQIKSDLLKLPAEAV
ncbi:MAG: tetratricopeptide repeat protein [Bacilli bacterium]|jgi:tetratricopeptide (TPR) repeat protein|nr:tetratricopeptide repeat protein [Bacilli bacterium]